MQNNKYYFIEDYSPNIDISGGTVISLLPDVSYKLGCRGISYKILEEYYDESALRKDEDKYFFEQLEWIEEFDRFLKENIKLCDELSLNITRAYFNSIKYLVDTLVIQSYIAKKFIENNNGCEITYIYDASKGPQAREIHRYNSSERTKFFQQIFSVLSEEKDSSFKFEEIGFAGEGFSGKPVHPDRGTNGESFRSFVRKVIKSGYHMLKYKKYTSYFNLLSRAQQYKRNVLFLHTSTIVPDHLARQFLRKGCNVYYLSDDVVYSMNDMFEKPVFSFKHMCEDSYYKSIKAETDLLSSTFGGKSSLVEWVNGKCGFDATQLILPYLKYFIEDVCSEILFKSKQFIAFYRDLDIDMVVATNASDNNSKSALIAAKKTNIDRIGFQHGTDIYNNRNWHINDIDNFDYYFTFEPLAEERFKKAVCLDYVNNTKIFQMSYRLTNTRTKRTSKNIDRERKKELSHKKRILYVPASKSNIHSRCYNNMTYPVLWYYELQRKLIDFFTSKQEFEFIYKHANNTTRQWASKSIVPYINSKNSKNIFLETRLICEYIGKIDGVIVDRPTTPLFEGAMLGKPLLCLIPEFMSSHIDKDAFSLFGDNIYTFQTDEDAVNSLNRFLEDIITEDCADPVRIPFRNDDVFEILTGVGNRRD